MTSVLQELGLTAFDKITTRYHDRVYSKAGRIPNKLVKKKTKTTRRSSSQPARQEADYEYEGDGPGRPRELKEEDWEVDEDPGQRRRGLREGYLQRKNMSETPYSRGGGTDVGYDQRGPPAYDNYNNAPPQAARAAQEVRLSLFPTSPLAVSDQTI